jgi:hypothetical protein
VIDYALGFLAPKRLGFVKGVRACAHLEAFLAAEHLDDGDLSGALDAMGTMFRLAECLAGEKHSYVRLQGSLVRMEALAVLQAALDHPELQRAHLDRAYHLIQNQLASWPNDADAWVADRALGMHAYEFVREGRATDLLTDKELERFAREGILETLNDTTLRNVDRDELYYLQEMRRIIDQCQRPYHQRLALFESLREEQHQMRASEEFPLVAARLLLPAVQNGQAIQARERANCEAWAIALARATGRQVPPFEVNPLNGAQYRSEEVDGKILVHDMGPDGLTPIVVPVLAQPDSKPQAESSQQTDP